MAKCQIRKGVFETNSSSVHTIVVADTYDKNARKDEIEHFQWHAWGEYGWENDSFSDAPTLADYACVGMINNMIEHDFSWNDSDYKAKAANARKVAIDKINGIIRKAYEFAGLSTEHVIFLDTEPSEREYRWSGGGYIDHADELWDLIDYLQHDDNLLRFVFGWASEVTTGNDNDEGSWPSCDSSGGTVFTKGN